ncbi:MAG: AMP-binding protein [Myxococcales bacterium]|nr:AMP-binding protein [Myxococcales bacterium]
MDTPSWSQTWAALRRDPPPARLARLARVAWRNELWRAARPAGWARLPGLARAPVESLPAFNAALTPDRLAWVDERQAVTWAEAAARVEALAAGLARERGLRAGDNVLILLENRVEYPLLWFALMRLGARAVHGSYDSTAAEVAQMIATARPALIVASARAQAAVAGVAVPVLAPEALPSGRPRRRGLWPRAARAGASVVFTSGTTGTPKGAVRSFGRLGAGELVRILDRLPLRHGERHLLVGRLYHSAGQAFLVLVAGLGGTVWLEADPDAARLARRLAEADIQSVFLVPTLLQRLLATPLPALPALRAVIAGAAPFPEALRAAAIERLGPGRIFDFYGATELGWVTVCDGFEMQARPGTVGRPLAGLGLQVVDDAGAILPTGAVGQVVVETSQGFGGYLGRPAATARVGVEDLGRLDADGYLYLAGRARDMVVSGGVNLYPAEIEDAIGQHPDVVEVAVIGAPDPDWGERLVAFVVVRAPVEAATLEAFARGLLAGPKVPRRWVFVDALPRNPTGKVQKALLRAPAAS